MNMTGHGRVYSFLTYIGMDQKRDSFADAFMQGVQKWNYDLRFHTWVLPKKEKPKNPRTLRVFSSSSLMVQS